MSPRRRWSRSASALLAALLGLFAPADLAAQPVTSPPLVTGPAETLVLAVSLNGAPAGDAVKIERNGPVVTMAAADLRALGFATRGTGRVALDTIVGLTWRIDPATQSIALVSDRIKPQRLVAGDADRDTDALTPSGWGAIISYDMTIAKAPRASEAAAVLDGSFYTPKGYAYATVLATAREGRRSGVTRLDTGFSTIDRTRMRRLVIGDTINGAAQFSRPVRMGGIQYGTDFSVRPDLVTFPLPNVAGTAAVPSTVDLIVNGSRRAAGEVRAGQFAVSDVPVQTGVNTITVAVRDALGRETLQTVSSYTSRGLLRPGLSSFGLEAGAVRLDYGSIHDRYGAAFFSATGRRGLTDRLTVEGHAEGSAKVASGGAGVTLGVGTIGQFDASIAGSRSADGTGAQVMAGFERIGGRVSIAARYARDTRRWQDIAARYGAVTRSHTLILNLGFDLRRFGTASVGLIDLGHGWARSTDTVMSRSPQRFRVAASRFTTATYSVRIGRRLSLLGTGGADLRQRRSFYAQIGLLATLNDRTTAFAGATARSGGIGGAAEVASNAVLPGQFGYRASVSRGAIDRIAGGGEYQGADVRLGIQAERTNGDFAARATARGSVIVSQGGVFTAQDAPNSVAIVDTNGLPGIRIYRDNRFAGTTNRNGRLVVTNLNPFVMTKLSIDPEQVSDDFSVNMRDVTVRPSERTGVAVRFDLHRETAALVTLVDDHGAVLPVGGRATANGRSSPVGLDGAVYLEGIGPSNRVNVTLPGGRSCTANFQGPAKRAPIVRIGPLRCAATRIAGR